MQRKTFTYNPKVVATEKNSGEATKQFEQILKDAPKPSDHPGINIVVNPKIEYTGKKMTLGDLLAEFGVNKKPTSVETTNPNLSNEKENNSPSRKI